MIEQKLKKIERPIPPPKTPVLGGSVVVPGDFSGSVVAGHSKLASGEIFSY